MRRISIRATSAVLALAALIFLAAAAQAGSVTGTVIYDDRVPPPKVLQMDGDPACAAKHKGPVYSERLVLGDGNTMGNVFIQVMNPPAGNYPAPSEPLIIDQVGCVYKPHVAGVLVGQTVKFKNSDGILHNVHGFPAANKAFNRAMPPILPEIPMVFNQPEPAFPVKCDVHPWMQSYLAVMTHPFFAVTEADGAFTLDGLPNGTYTVTAWHEHLGTREAEVKVEGGKGTVDVKFKIPER